MKSFKYFISSILILTASICVFTGCRNNSDNDKPNNTTTINGYVIESKNNEKIVTKYIGNDEHLTIPDNVTQLGERAFKDNTKIKSVKLSDTVKEIGEYCFSGCNLLFEIECSNSLTTIDDCAFYSCDLLTNIKMGEGIQTISESAFSNCPSLNYNEYGNANYFGNETNPYIALIKAKKESIYTCEINTDVKILANGCFSGCYNLSSISIPNQITVIPNEAFSYAHIKNINLPNNLQNIEKEAFYSCIYLESISLPETLLEIGESAFYWNRKLTNIQLPTNLKKIKTKAFNYCENLIEVNIPSSVDFIGKLAFEDCYDLSSVNFETITGWSAGENVVDKEYLSYPATAATFIGHTYVNFDWMRK